MPMAASLHHAAVSKYCHPLPLLASEFFPFLTQASLVNSGPAVLRAILEDFFLVRYS